MEVTDYLNIGEYKIVQDDGLYRFTSDSTLLSRFVRTKSGDVVADFCSGSGIVGLQLYALNPKIKSVTLFEMQKPLFDLSVKNVAINNLESVFRAENVKIQEIGAEYNEKFSLIVCNPPYMPRTAGFDSENFNLALCRQEIALTLEELFCAVSKKLKFGGRFCLVHRADRLADLICFSRTYKLEPKRLAVVSPKGKTQPYLVLLECVKGGKSGIKITHIINANGEII